MKDLKELLFYLHSKEVKIWADGDHLHISAPKENLTQDLRSELAERKTEILAFLRETNLATSTISGVIKPVQQDKDRLLSFAQQRLWFLAHLEDNASRAYHIHGGVKFTGVLDKSALKAALDRIVWRHEVLRTTFSQTDEGALQVISPPESRFFLLEHDLTDSCESELEHLIAEEALATFNLFEGPLIRGRLIRVSEKEHILLVTMHHIISDEWSMGVFINELGVLYQAFLKGRCDPLPPLGIQFADYAVWQRKQLEGDVLQQQLSYWMKKLNGAPSLLELPMDYPRPAAQNYTGTSIRFMLDTELTNDLIALSQRHDVTLFMTLLAGWAALLSRLSAQSDIVIGTPVANRTRTDIEPLIGFFVNTLALRVDLTDQPTVAELLIKIKHLAIEAQSHQDIPFEQVVEAVNPERSLSYNPLFQVMFAWQNRSESRFDLGDLLLEEIENPRTTTQFDLTLFMRKADGRIKGELEYATALFEQGTLERYLAHFKELLRAMAAGDSQKVGQLQLLSAAERRQVLFDWNATTGEYPKNQCIHALFEAEVKQTPDAVAVVYENEQLTYAQLNSQANQLARHLIALGVVPDTKVAICLERSLEMVVGLLAILKAGGAYVPLDPAYPLERLEFMLEDSAPVALLINRVLKKRWSNLPEQLAVIEIDDGEHVWKGLSPSNINLDELGLTENHLAYVIYTSGSTGKPKGVMVEHTNVVRLFSATDAWFHFGPDDVWTLFHSYAFDFSVWEIWGALLFGGRLVVVPQLTKRSPGEFYQLLCQQKVTVLNQTPSAFKQLIAAQAQNEPTSNHRLRLVIFGGETLDVASLKPWYARNDAEDTQLVNMYGITETTVHVTYRPLSPADTQYPGASPIGSRIPDLSTYILDQHLQPVPVGVIGELYISGAGVARGYLNRPELSAEYFLPDPFVDPMKQEPNPRMYKTGDLGRWLADGSIEYLGRNDSQIKIRGFRIELGEIETQLAVIKGVKAVTVLLREDSPGDKRLIAYYTSDEDLTVETLRSSLSSVLPGYMVPAAFVRLVALPLTPNGKLDRKALPAPEGEAFAVRAYEEPEGVVEQTLATIWSDLLHIDKIGRRDHFFELGGHSLLAVTLISRLGAQELHTDVRTLFTTPVLCDLAATIGSEEQQAPIEVPSNLIPADCEHITPDLLPLVDLTQADIDRIAFSVPGGAANIQDIYPLGPLQEGILFLHLMAQEGDAYLLPSVLAFDTKKRLDDFIKALQMVIDRQDLLRTAVQWEGLSEPVQVVWRNAPLYVEEVILTGANVEKEIYNHIDPRHHRIDVQKAPMMRAFIGEDKAQGRWLLGLLNHHLSIEHTTLELIIDEVQAHLAGEQQHLPEPLPYRNFVAQARLGVSREEHEAFFRQMLAPVTEPTAPFGLMNVQGDGSNITEAQIQLDSALCRRLREHARQMGVSVASLCHLAWAQVLSRLTGREEVVFGTVLFGRMQGGKGVDQAMGMFINTLPVRIIAGGESVKQAVHDIHTLLARLLRHEHAPLSLVQRCSAVPPPAPLFTTVLNYRYSQGDNGLGVGTTLLEGTEVLFSEERLNYPFAMDIDDLGKGFALTAQVQEPIDPMRICEYMSTSLANLTDTLERAPQTAVRSIEVMSTAERQQVLYDWNVSKAPVPENKCIHQLFEEQVEKIPDAVAVVYEDEQLTYAQLNSQANKLACYLTSLGVVPDTKVAICLEKSIEMVVGLLAILKSGGAYVPLDPAYPTERLEFMLEDSAPMALLMQSELKERCSRLVGQAIIVELDADNKVWQKCSSKNISPDRLELTPQHLAYVIYTSGSTGKPKGVMVEHRSLVNQVVFLSKRICLGPDDRFLQFASVSFDASVEEVFTTLTSGATLVLRTDAWLTGARDFWSLCQHFGVSVVDLPTQFWSQLIQEPVPIAECVRKMIPGGEMMNEQSLQAFFARSDHRPDLINSYGPTETTINATLYEPGDSEDWRIIGRPIANTRVYILDQLHRPVPIGVTGELYIGGIQVARGYLNRPTLTEERFLRDPFVKATKQEPRPCMYKTGDLGRFLPDGVIEFLGRNDFQVKIRGFRIELGELETRLAAIDGVKEAVVLATEDNTGDKRLTAYYTCSDELTAEILREQLSSELPGYMVPAAYVRLENMPLTMNGKLDRKALPDLEGADFGSSTYEEPQGELEQTLAKIWSGLLHIEKIGRRDHFFELGGHSLLAIKLNSRIRKQLAVELLITELFTYPVLSEMASFIRDATRSTLPAIKVADRTEPLPLSFAQQRLWFLDQLEDNASRAYQMPGGVKLTGCLDRATFKAVMNRIVWRHEVLRTTFIQAEGGPQQVIGPPEQGFFLLEHDLTDRSESELESLIVLEAETPFDLEAGPLIRGRLIRRSETEHILLLSMHHIISDDWSMGVLINELGVLYPSLLKGQEDPLQPLAVQYADYAVWQRKCLEGDLLQQQLIYWKKKMKGAPELLELPADHPRPAVQDYTGATIDFEIDAELTKELKALSRRHGVTLFMTLFTGWAAFLAHLSGQDDIVIGTPVANRTHSEIEPLIGFFVNTLALRVDLSNRPTVAELLARVKQLATEAQSHQDIPFEQVVEAVNPFRSLSRSPLFQVMFDWQSNPEGRLELEGLKIEGIETPHTTTQFDLTLTMAEVKGEFVGSAEYATALFKQGTIEQYLVYYRTLLRSMVADDSQKVDRLQILGQAERQQVLYDWNANLSEYPKDKCIHELFEAQVDKTPNAVAVVYNGEQLTYAQLNSQANRLARHLIALGVVPESKVAICVERNLAMVVGLWAILKAGGAYVPMEPTYPVDRLAFMLKDSESLVLLTQRSFKERWSNLPEPLTVIELDAKSKTWRKRSSSNLVPSQLGLTPQHLAYVIYTSGSTGNPKGVMVEHCALVNYSLAAANVFGLTGSDIVLQQNTLTFDLSVEEIFPALVSGAALRPSQDIFGVSGIYDRQGMRPTVVHLTAAHWHSLVAEWSRSPESARQCLREVRLMNVTGDQLSNQKLRLWEGFRSEHTRLINTYGPTEATVSCTAGYVHYDSNKRIVPIGIPLTNASIYVLDRQMQPVPIAVTGELYIGGIQVARGYLNRPELTKVHFLPNPFVKATEQDPHPRMYKTGDLGRWLSDGTIEFLGRDDFQVKMRGFRIELGEIETRLTEIDGVKEAVAIARENSAGEKHLIVYYTSGSELNAETLRNRLSVELPEYMVPTAYVWLKALPLTPSGKLDRKSLQALEDDALITRAYEKPQGELEESLAAIWSDLLNIEKVGRRDHFFELGGHSLLAVSLISRLKEQGMHADVRILFTTPVLYELATAIGDEARQAPIEVPPNLISVDCEYITPEMLPLVDLTQADIERIALAVPGGAANIQDIYPLAPLQKGILFHHLLEQEGDVYLEPLVLSFKTKQRLQRFVEALQKVIDRHDILRTAVQWESLPESVQVVWRRARIPFEDIILNGDDAADDLYNRIDPRRHRLDVRQAPMMRAFIAEDTAKKRWLLGILNHHLAIDHTTLELIVKEVQVHLKGEQQHLPEPLAYRNFIAQARYGVSIEEHEEFFRQMLGTVEEPTAPFDMMDVQLDGSGTAEATLPLGDVLCRQMRDRSRVMGVSVASLCHLAWAQVLSRLTGREDVVFGTVLFGRMQGGEGVEQAMGMFINTLPVRIASGEEPVEQAVRTIHTQLAHLLLHENAPLSMAQRCSAVPFGAPLFTALLNYRYGEEDGDSGVGETVWDDMELIHGEERTNYPFTMNVDDFGDRFSLTAQIQEPIDPMRICEYMHTALIQLTDFLKQAPQTPARFVGVMSEAERRQVLLNWNVTEAEIPEDKCIHQLFEAQVEKTPNAVAVVYEDKQLSYTQLNRQANRLARHLIAMGVVPDSKVAICMERSPEMMVGLLAILKAGGAYVPLDPGYPDQRLGFMLKDSVPLVLLTQRSFKERWSNLAGSVKVIELDTKTQAWRKRSGKNPRPEKLGLTPQHLAYVIYTSGSTGKPKGVMVEHAGLLNYIYWTTQQYSPCQSSIVSSSLAFDATITSLYSPIVRGGKVILLKQGDEIEGLEEIVATHKTDSLIKITPAHLEVLGTRLERKGVEAVNNTVVVGGEALSPSTVKKWQQLYPKSRIVNEYGPTETVVGCIAYEVEKGFSGSHQVPIGRPIANTRIYILDQHRQPVPIGVTGELYIGGAGVARGYLNRPKTTEERFLPDPFANPAFQGASPRMYRTGDLARFLPDGTIEYLGRSDFQVKIRGFRIELGEIETRLSSIDGVREVVVLAREDSPGDKRLVAYYTSSDELTPDPLRSHLSNELPEYMVPAAFVRLEDLPLTPNGKLDRKALPAPEGDAFGYRTYEEPQGEVEQTLAAIWADLLPVERVGRHDHFFKLGGHSLLAVTLISRMSEEGLDTDVRTLFATPVLWELGAAIRHKQQRASITVPPNLIATDCQHITPELLPLVELSQADIDRIALTVPGGAFNIQDIYPLAPLQEGILFHHLMDREGDVYLEPSILAFKSHTLLDRFMDAIQKVIKRHDILRTAVHWQGLSEPVQVVWRNAPVPVEPVELSEEHAEEDLYKRIDPRRHRIDVCQAPLLRAFIGQDKAQGRWLLGLLSHHMVIDHTTLEIIVNEVQAHLLGKQDRLPKPLAYRNFVVQARYGVSREEHEAFFSQMLATVDEPTAPFDLMDVQGDGSGINEAKMQIDSALCQRLREQARVLGVGVACLCHLAWAQVLSRLTGRDDVVFGTVLFGRMQGGVGTDQTMGMFINTLPVRIVLGDEPVEQAVRATHTLLARLLHHEHAPLSLAQGCSAVPSPAPLFTTLLNYRYGQGDQVLEIGETAWDGMETLSGEERSNYPLTLSVDDLGEDFELTAQVQEPVDPMRICRYMYTALDHLTAALEQTPQTAVRSIEVMSSAERQQVLFDWNATEVKFPKARCIHRLFEEQAEKTPDAVALIYEDKHLTYARLNRQANQLARYLISLGVVPDTRVAICLERSLEMVVGLLAILKAGGAYVPLDPAYPDQRLEFMLNDSAPLALLTQRSFKDRWSNLPGKMEVIELDAQSKAWGKRSGSNPDPEQLKLTTEHLAYVIYTSGSTGTPKGVMVEHRNLFNLIQWHGNAFSLKESDSSSCLAGFGFDASTWETWPPLCIGAKLLLAPAAVAQDPAALLSWWQKQPFDVSFLPTPIAEHAFTAGIDNDKLRYLLTGGDRLHRLPVSSSFRLVNNYGPTEATVVATCGELEQPLEVLHIGRPVANTQVYILDRYQRPMPAGAVGELYIGGAGVARGYLNRPELTDEMFLPDPFAKAVPEGPIPRMYKTGDLGRFLPDGTIEYLGRNDFQVKVRGFRIELGEIETRLAAIDGIKEVAVLSREESSVDKRLVAYYTGSDELTAETLRIRLSSELPEYMVPAAFVRLEELPLTPNGKLDRKALPSPTGDAFSIRAYQEPQGEMEEALSTIWSELLHLEKVGRHDHFFELGGHSLLAVALISRMSSLGLHTDVRTLFTTPVLCELATAIGNEVQPVPIEVPPNLIAADCKQITPDLLPLVELTQADIERIVQSVPGGAANIQDIYPLSPLQEGILFHHLMDREGDLYLLPSVLAFDSKTRLDHFINALQLVIDRHDILRTAVQWEGFPEPVQVVWRNAPLPMVEEVVLSGDNAADDLYRRIDPRHHRIDIRQAPLIRVIIGEDKVQNRWLLGLLSHHLFDDHTTTELIVSEVQAHLTGAQDQLPEPVPYRNFVAQARLGVSIEEHETFFKEMLATVEEPTAPFELMDVQGDGSNVSEEKIQLDIAFCRRLRERARQMGVSVASLCHLAWAQVLSRLIGREEVVFGTVLFGRMQGIEGADRALGMFINTLPVRIVAGDDPVNRAVRATHTLLSRLLYHEHAPLALAQRCSAVPPSAPLFTTLLNYRHSLDGSGSDLGETAWDGMEVLHGEERSNYPLGLNVDDYGEGFELTAWAQAPIDPMRLCGYMYTALKHLTDALEHAPQTAVRSIEVMSETEKRQVLFDWNNTAAEYPKDKCIHHLFEEQVEKTPDNVAVIYEDEQLTYAQLNSQANQLAHYLSDLGVVPDTKVAICVERSLEMVVGLLAILKADGAYVPLDPAYPEQRLLFMLEDSASIALLTQQSLKKRWSSLCKQRTVIELDGETKLWQNRSVLNPDQNRCGLTPEHLACVIYTSGSTGKPKGVMVEHRGVINQIVFVRQHHHLNPDDRILQFASLSFDVSAEEIFPTLASGAALVLRTDDWLTGAHDFWTLCQRYGVSVVDLPTQFWSNLIQDPVPLAQSVRQIVIGGEMISEQALNIWFARKGHRVKLINTYGPTETTINTTRHEPCNTENLGTVGRPVANTRIYILDQYGQPVPIGIIGELYIGGAGVARGYLSRPELTEDRFLTDPFVDPSPEEPSPRMYKTGDMGRFLSDGNIEFIGRNDFQVKIRGFRINLGEIESKLASIDGVKDVAVLLREDNPGDKRLIAYYTCSNELTAETLRERLSSALPVYMVPAAFVRLTVLPLNPNGKLDRKALKPPESKNFTVSAYEEPEGKVERCLADIWSDLLHHQKIGRHDNFFELGGNSLLSVTLISRMRAQGLHADVRTLFMAPTISNLAAAMKEIVPPDDFKVPDNPLLNPSELDEKEVLHEI